MEDVDFSVLEADVRAAVRQQDFRNLEKFESISLRLRQAASRTPRDDRVLELAVWFERTCHVDYIKTHKLQRFLDGLVEIVVATRATDPLLEMIAAIEKRTIVN